jgi:glycosyltransferase involved in cell wall biosynthesis
VLDLWPDLFVKAFPRPLRFFGHIAFSPWFVLSRRTYSMAAKVTAVSRTYAEWARTRAKRLDRENFSHYYLGCEVRQPPPARAPQDRLRVLFTGQFGFNYDLETVLAVARRLWEQGHRNIEFVLAGDGYKRGALMKQARDLPNVHFTGWVAWDRLPELASECNLGLSCYTREATQSVPTKIFDYMALGLAIVNSIPGEAAELIADAQVGWQYVPEDAGSLSVLLAELGRRVEDVIKAGRRARQAYEQRFDASLIYENMINDMLLPSAGSGAFAESAELEKAGSAAENK